jgi:membrane protein required for colicin V production
MNFIDIIIILITSYFVIRGIFRGFINELAVVLGFVFGYLLIITYSGLFSDLLSVYLPKIPRIVINIISLVSIFILTNLAIKLVAKLATTFLSFIMLGWLNRLLGAFFGFIKIVIIMSFFIFLMELLSPFSAGILRSIGKEDSILYAVLNCIATEVFNQIKDMFN